MGACFQYTFNKFPWSRHVWMRSCCLFKIFRICTPAVEQTQNSSQSFTQLIIAERLGQTKNTSYADTVA